MTNLTEANQPALMQRFAEAVEDSGSVPDHYGYLNCAHCSQGGWMPSEIKHSESCIVLEAQAYLAEPSPNHDEAVKAFTDSIEHFRNAAKAVGHYVENDLVEKDHVKHYTKRVAFYTETADTLETLKNWLEKTK